MNQKLYTAGPVPLDEEILFSALPSRDTYHRSLAFSEKLDTCRNLLAPIFGVKNRPLVLTSSGTGGMEAALLSVTKPGDRALVIEAGKFGERWTDMARTFGLEVDTFVVPLGENVNLVALETALGKTPYHAVLWQDHETSTGFKLPTRDIAKIARAKKARFLVVDAISSLIAHPFRADEWGIDVVITGSQKGFSIPAGLAFVSLSDAALGHKNDRQVYYFDLRREWAEQEKKKTAWTPAILNILMLEKALLKIQRIGAEELVRRHEAAAKQVRQAMTGLGFQVIPGCGNTLTAFYTAPVCAANDLLKALETNRQMVFAPGQDELNGKIIRFAHLGLFSPAFIQEGIDAIRSELGFICREPSAKVP